MHALGIATTRSLAVVTTGESVIRETELPGAILTRIAASHLRVGTFQYVSQWGTVEELRALADYTIQRHFPYIDNNEGRYLCLLQDFITLTFDKSEDTVLFGTAEFTQWYELWQARQGRQPETKSTSRQLMQNSNPALIPRNHRVEEALEAAVKRGDYSVMDRLLDVLSKPYFHCPKQVEYSIPPEISTRPYRTAPFAVPDKGVLDIY